MILQTPRMDIQVLLYDIMDWIAGLEMPQVPYMDAICNFRAPDVNLSRLEIHSLTLNGSGQAAVWEKDQIDQIEFCGKSCERKLIEKKS